MTEHRRNHRCRRQVFYLGNGAPPIGRRLLEDPVGVTGFRWVVHIGEEPKVDSSIAVAMAIANRTEDTQRFTDADDSVHDILHGRGYGYAVCGH